MNDEFEFVKVEKIFRICPNCGYKDGFHSMFERTEDKKKFVWRFICPSCHKVFDIGLNVSAEI